MNSPRIKHFPPDAAAAPESLPRPAAREVRASFTREKAMRSVVALMTMMMLMAGAARAEDGASGGVTAPTPAVAAAWKQEAPKPSPALRTLFVSYAGLQGLDVASTSLARTRGAVEANPLLRGSAAANLATRAALGAVTIAAARAIDTHSRKAAILTMIAANAATAAVAVHNYRVAARLHP